MNNKKNKIYLMLIIMVSVVTFLVVMLNVMDSKKETFDLDLINVISLVVIFLMVVGYIKITLIKETKYDRRIAWLENKLNYWNTISYKVKNVGDNVFRKLPVGILVYDEDNTISWANEFLKKAFTNALIDRKIDTIHKSLHKDIADKQEKFIVSIYNKRYDVIHNIKNKVLYFFEVTSRENLFTKYEDSVPALLLMQLDNYEDAMASLYDQDRTQILSRYLTVINEWAEEFKVFVQGYSENRYLVFLNKSQLQAISAEKFSILDKIREVSSKYELAITLSIGASCNEISMDDLGESAQKSMDVALSRGGDQVVTNVDNEIKYFGGKTNTIAKKDKVRARVIAGELKTLMENSSNVIIMGHIFPDTDAFGGCVGLLKIAQSLGKNAKIVIDNKKLEPTVKRIIEKTEREYVGILSSFIDPRDATYKIEPNTLLIVCDCHKKEITIDPKLVDKAEKIAVIDHHRRGNQVITNADLFYVEPYSSSSVELVTEIIQFFQKDVVIQPYEATLMLAGLIVDTNNFTYRTSSRTFEVASYLKTLGADTIKIKTLLREEANIYKEKNEILNNLEIVNKDFTIVKLADDKIVSRTMLAQVADEALTVNNINASFAIGYIDQKVVGIAARSFGEVNVQVLMEKMGGGGHLNNAATQIRDDVIESVYEKVKILLSKNEEKSETMKIILSKEIKSKGKEGDIVEVAAGYGNFLINSKQAIHATTANIRNLEAKNSKQLEDDKKALDDMKRLKLTIESNGITCKIKLGQNGKMFGKVSSKQIVEEYDRKYKIKLDRKKLLLAKSINTLGMHNIKIQLHKDVTAEIQVQVVEG